MTATVEGKLTTTVASKVDGDAVDLDCDITEKREVVEDSK